MRRRPSRYIGVCCDFYGGDYDERTGECWIDHEAQLEEADPGPSVPRSTQC